jgi:predicted secreted protein
METLDNLLAEYYNVIIQYVGNKRWKYQVVNKGNWFTSSTYGSAKEAEKALEADSEEIINMLSTKAGKPE